MESNFAFIDSQNLNLSIRSLGWKIDYQKFRRYLKEKYNVSKAIAFIGFIKENETLYQKLRNSGYELVFKPTKKIRGTIKGNCDAELVLHAVSQSYENLYKKAVIVTGDGDFHCLIEFLLKKQKLEKLLIPNQRKYSAFLRNFPNSNLAFISDLKKKLENK